eukprot:3558168-Rhodomonas_salina.3
MLPSSLPPGRPVLGICSGPGIMFIRLLGSGPGPCVPGRRGGPPAVAPRSWFWSCWWRLRLMALFAKLGPPCPPASCRASTP